MPNSVTDHSIELRKKTTSKINKEKLERGEYIVVSITISDNDAIKPFLANAVKNKESKSGFVRKILNEKAERWNE